MLFRRHLLLAFIAVARLGTDDAAASTLDIACNGTVRLQAPYPTARVAVTRPAWFEIRANGSPIRVTSDASAHLIALSQPLRYASTWVHLEPGQLIDVSPQDSRSSAPLTVTRRCDFDAEAMWLAQIVAIDRATANPSDAATLTGALSQLDTLETIARSDPDRALVDHYRALALMGMNRAREAADVFDRVGRQWSRLGDAQRAQAARLGRIEAQVSDGQFEDVITRTGGPQTRGPDRYFDARIAAARCNAIEASGQLADADACYRRALARYQALGEANEVANTYSNLANVARKQGRLAVARQLAERGIDSAGGTYAPMILGRLHSLLAALHRQTGNVAATFHELQLADDELARADTQAPLYRAYGRLYEADLLLQIGALPEAYERLASIWTLIRPADAGDMLAFAAKILSDLERDSQHPQVALFWLRITETAYARSGNQALNEVTRLARLQLQFEAGDLEAVDAGLRAPRHSPPAYDRLWQLLEAEAALARGRLDEAGPKLAALGEATLPLRDRVRFAVAQARYAEVAGRPAEALSHLAAEFSRVQKLSSHAGSAALRQVMMRQTEALRREASAIALQPGSDPADAIRTLWPWLAPAPYTAGIRVAGSAADFDAAVARDLLGASPAAAGAAERSADAALFARLAQSGDNAFTAQPATTIEALQRSLEPHSLYLAVADGGTRSALVAITPEAARLVPIADPSALARSISELRDALRSRASDNERWQAAAARVSTQLLGGLAATEPPSHLRVAADGLLANVVWGALTWPGQAQPLIETTDVVRIVSTRVRAGTPERAALHVVLAPQFSAPSRLLTALPVAAAEADLIRVATDHPVSVIAGRDATRASILDLFAESGAWIHIAAHGSADPQRIGYSGVWLEAPNGGAAPEFLSWLDILDRGTAAEMVVLDACRLDDRDTSNGSNLSFAEAIARAGAGDVVAASWPISDAAAALWVPAFYAALRADPAGGAAAALRAAQARLRHSREFAHPYYWSGLQEIGHVDLASAVVAASAH